MVRKNFFFFLLLSILILVQASFSPGLGCFWLLNLPLIFFVWLIIFKESQFFIYPAAIWTGFLLDVFSDSFLGASILILCLETFVLRKVLRNFKKQNFLIFLIFALFFILIYHFYFLLIRLLLKHL